MKCVPAWQVIFLSPTGISPSAQANWSSNTVPPTTGNFIELSPLIFMSKYSGSFAHSPEEYFTALIIDNCLYLVICLKG